jgi:hypothetical protein
MHPLYVWDTSIGPFSIAEHEGRFFVVFEGESLGGYATAALAAADVAGGHTFGIRSGVDPAKLGIPDDLAEWHKCERGPSIGH